MILSYKYRIKDSALKKQLLEYAWQCNVIWNFCIEYNRTCMNFWPSHFDLTKATKEVAKGIGILADTCGEICRQFVSSRNTHRRTPKFRKSSGRKRSLGWVPFKGRNIRIDGNHFYYRKKRVPFWKHRSIPHVIKTGVFVEDSAGRWFVSFHCEVDYLEQAKDRAIGIDLGLKSVVTTSNGEKTDAERIFRSLESKLAVSQRSKNKKRTRAIHQKIKNKRQYFNHVLSSKLSSENRTIIVGNVSSSKLSKTKMAKSVLDAGWYQLKSQLEYKVRRRQGVYKVVNEAFTTQTCSSCGNVSGNSPKGRAGLNKRSWVCECGAVHDRDINSAINILFLGLERKPHGDGISNCFN